MGFCTFREGSWILKSETDKRWNVHGRSACMSAIITPEECTKKIEELTKKYGPPPEDLTISQMKD